MERSNLSKFIKQQRKKAGLNQEDVALRAGISLKTIRSIEQGKITVRMDKVNAVLFLFGAELGVTALDRSKL